MHDVLDLVPLSRAGVKFPGGSYKSERHFLDFVVNGQSLWNLLAKRHDLVSVFCLEYAKEETAKAVKRLLLAEKADLPNDRRSLFVCSECGDLGCGAITAVVAKNGSVITWQDFGYENTYQDALHLDQYKTAGPFTFNAITYARTIEQAMDQLRKHQSGA